MTHSRRPLGIGTDHEAGRVAQEQDRQPKRVAQLQEAGRLVGRVGVDRTAEMRGIVCDDAERLAFDPREHGNHPRPEALAQLEQRVLIAETVQDLAHLISALALLRHDLAKQALVWHGELLERPVEI